MGWRPVASSEQVKMRSIQRVVLLILWVLFGNTAVGQTVCPVAELSDSDAFSTNLGPYACVFVDESRTLSLSEVLTPGQTAKFEPVPSELVDFGFGAARYWVRINLRNATAQTATWWITHDLPVPEHIEVHLITQSAAPQELLDMVASDPFGARKIPHRHLASSVTLNAGQSAEMVINYVTGQSTQMPLFAEAVPNFMKRTQTETARHVALIALILGMGVISTIYFFSLQGLPALIYGAYVLVTVAMLAHMEGYLFQYLYPAATRFNALGFTVFGCLSVGLGLLFVDRLTATRQHTPRLHLLVLATVAALAALIAFVHFYISTPWFKIAILLTTALGTIVQVIIIAAAMQRRQSGAWLLLIAFVAVSAGVILVVIGYMTEGLFPQELAGAALRGGYLLEAFAFSGAIALRVREARRSRDHSLREQLRLSQEQLRLSEALRRAEEDRQDAERVAQASRDALASAAHDIRQPLASIQMAIAGGAEAASNIEGSLSYIEGIVKEGLEGGPKSPLGDGDHDPPALGSEEKFEASIVLSNIATMFAQDAQSRNIALNAVPSTAVLKTDPLALMRGVSNLVANALEHSGASKILIGSRRTKDRLRIEVHDNGEGIPPDQLKRLMARGQSGEGSPGYGLGTGIVAEIAEDRGLEFAIRSAEGKGTVASLGVPLASAHIRSGVT